MCFSPVATIFSIAPSKPTLSGRQLSVCKPSWIMSISPVVGVCQLFNPFKPGSSFSFSSIICFQVTAVRR